MNLGTRPVPKWGRTLENRPVPNLWKNLRNRTAEPRNSGTPVIDLSNNVDVMSRACDLAAQSWANSNRWCCSRVLCAAPARTPTA